MYKLLLFILVLSDLRWMRGAKGLVTEPSELHNWVAVVVVDDCAGPGDV